MSTRATFGIRSGIRRAVVATVGAGLVLPAAWASAAPAAVEAAPVLRPAASTSGIAPLATQVARVATEGGPRLRVRVGPARNGPEGWQFTLERKAADGWEWDGDYLTEGTKDEVTIPVSAGTYRVVVPAQFGYPSATSKPQSYSPTPEITVGGYGALEVKVGPVRDWQVTLERNTDQGWVRAKQAKTQGLTPMVFSVDDGTYRVRTEANGRFPAYTSAPFDFARQAPPGPIAYERIAAMFSSPPAGKERTRAATTRSTSSGCASVMNSSSTGINIATGLVNLVPDVGGSIGIAVDAIATNAQDSAEEACLSGQFATINAQLSYQEGQIEQIQQELTAAEDAFVAYEEEVAVSDLATFQNNTWNPAVLTLGGCSPGAFLYDFMVDFGFWDGCEAQMNVTVEGVATSPAFASQTGFGLNEQSDFSSNLNNVSGTQVSCSDGSLLPTPSIEPDCYTRVTGHQVSTEKSPAQSTLLQLQQDLAAVLNAAYSNYLVSGQNVVPLYDTYHLYLQNYYLQAVTAVQSAYTVESLINQLNFYNGSMNTPIDSLGLVNGTYYSWADLKSRLSATPTASQQAQYYNLAQQALTQVYAARMNQLYINTLNFMVTDGPAGSQAWPGDPFSSGTQKGEALDYADDVGKYVTSGTEPTKPADSTPLSMLPPAATNAHSWTDSAVLYQYYGLRDTQTCYANLLRWNKANGTAVQGEDGTWYPTAYPSQAELSQTVYDAQCPPILIGSQGGAVTAPTSTPPAGTSLTSCATYADPANNAGGSCYDGNTLAPYYVADGAMPEATSSVLTNLLLCNSGDPSLAWFQVGPGNAGNAAGLTLGDWALTCGNWAAPAGPGWPGDRFPRSTPPNSWGDTVQYSCPSGSTASYCAGGDSTNIWGPFYYGAIVGGTNYVPGYTFNEFSVPGYFDPQLPGTLAYVPSSTATPLNIGGQGATTTLAVQTASCYSGGGWTTGANVSLFSSGCTITFDPVSCADGQDAKACQSPAGLAVLSAALPNTAAGASSGFALPMTVGVTPGPQSDAPFGLTWNTLTEVWLPSNTSIADVGYLAPASTVDSSSGQWSQNGYITVADGSCWSITVGRNADNWGTVSFNQVTPGSACAS